MHYIEAPGMINKSKVKNPVSLFIAGGITGCPDWQREAIRHFEDIDDLIVYNPRRKEFNIADPNASHDQIKWERDRFKESDIILFWFCKETIQPITLFELGKYAFSNKYAFYVGIEPGYSRSTDVITQLKLEFKDIEIWNNLDKMCIDVHMDILNFYQTNE